MAELADVAVYRRLLGARMRAEWQYRTSLFVRIASSMLITGLDVIVIALIFTRVSNLEGWSLAEVAFLYGTSGIAFDVADICIGGIEWLYARVKLGTFDRMLLRPLSPLAQLAIEEFTLRRFGRLIQSTTVFVISLGALDVDWTPAKAAMVPLMIAVGVLIYTAVWVVTTAISFWTVEIRELSAAFTYGGNFLTQYPVTIYAEWMRRLLAFVLPMAFVSYFPALYVLGRDNDTDRLGLPPIVMFSSPLVAAVALAVAAFVWRRGIRHYRSTGS